MNIYDINRIKTEFCATCLSRNRAMFTVKDLKELLVECSYIMLSQEELICWECKAMLKKMQLFKFRATQAQNFLNKIRENQVVYETSSLQSLSHLDICNVHEILCVIESQPSQITDDECEDVKPMIEVDMIKCEVDFDSNNDYSDNIEINVDALKVEKDSLSTPDTQNEEKISEEYVSNKIMYEYKNTSIHYKTRTISHEELSKKRQKKLNHKNFQRLISKCSTCLLNFRDQSLLNMHMEKRHSESAGQLVCDICEQRFQRKHEIRLHIKEHYRWYKCVACNYECDRKDELNNHRKIKHVNVPKTCKICGKVFPTRHIYFLHLKTHRARPLCNHCGKSFRNKTTLVGHLCNHADNTKLECNLCNKKLQTLIGLKCHMKWHNKVTNKDQTTYCVECNKQFKSDYFYRQHLKTSRAHVAESDMKYKCPYCNKGFPVNGYIKRHIAYHHTEKRNHICQICNKAFPVNEKLVRHIKSIHEAVKRPKNHMCDMCSKTFYDKGALQEHINSHTGKRPYVCEFCDATFSYSAARFTHTKLKHNKQKQQKEKQKQSKDKQKQSKDKQKQPKDKQKLLKDKQKQQDD